MLLKDISLEIESFCKTQCLTQYEIMERKRILQKIKSLLKPFYPDCQLYIYGSTLNGYGTKESDLDLLFLPYSEYYAENPVKEVEKREAPNSPSLYDVYSGQITTKELLSMDRDKQLSFVRKVLRREKDFQRILLILARCPIIHFHIPQLEIDCDISCGSRHVVSNTKLLSFCNRIDGRLQTLVITLRHWAKSLKIIQSGVLSSYAFTLLVVFFLQVTEPPVLPSIKYLQELAESPIMEDCWNIAFTTDITKVKKSMNNKSSGELLKDFFVFCGEFDFSNNIVCPSLGKSIPIKELTESSDVRLKEFEVSSMCIQDPFLLSFNTSRNVKINVFDFFRQTVYSAIKILEEWQPNDKFDLLFDKDEYTKLSKEFFSPPISGKSKSFIVSLSYPSLLKESEIRNVDFYDVVCNALIELMQLGLLIECEVVDKVKVNKDKAKNQDGNDFQFLMCVQCAIFHRTFVGRKTLSEEELPVAQCDFEQCSNIIIQKEYKLSNHLIEQNPLLSSPEPFFWFYCECYLHIFGKLNNLVIVVTPLTDSKERKSVFSFLQTFIQTNLPKILSDSINFKPYLTVGNPSRKGSMQVNDQIMNDC